MIRKDLKGCGEKFKGVVGVQTIRKVLLEIEETLKSFWGLDLKLNLSRRFCLKKNKTEVSKRRTS
jgi:hypothetical protein